MNIWQDSNNNPSPGLTEEKVKEAIESIKKTPVGDNYWMSFEEYKMMYDFVEVRNKKASVKYPTLNDWTEVTRFCSLGLQGVEIREIKEQKNSSE